MAAVEVCVTKAVGEFPYGPPLPDEVALASAALRALVYYNEAVARGKAHLPPGISSDRLSEARVIAQARFMRAVIGSMTIAKRPIENRTVITTPTDPEATNATSGLAEAQLLYDEHMANIDRYAEKESYGVHHEAALEAALLYVPEIAEEEWQIREAQEVAASRGYTDVHALLAIPQTPATIDEYARTS